MSTRILLYTTICLLFTVAAPAQQPASSGDAKVDPADHKWMDARVALIHDAYGLNPAQTKVFSGQLTALWKDQRQYQFETNVTLRGIRAAMRDVTASGLVAPENRAAFQAKFERQLYDFVYLKAPMSYANLLKGVEAGLASEQVARGRDHLKKMYQGATEFSLDTVDWDLRRPVEMPSMAVKERPSLPAFEPMAESAPPRTPPKSAKPKVEKTARPTAPPTTPAASPPAKTTPPKPLKPAPPVDQWVGLVDQTIAKYNFSEQQKTQAQEILHQCQDNARMHKRQYEKGNQKAEGSASGLKTLNHKLDTIYNQLAERVESLATLEQKHAADSTAKTGGT